jgi:hypothetical protein
MHSAPSRRSSWRTAFCGVTPEMVDQRVSDIDVEKEPVDTQAQKRLLEQVRTDGATSDRVRDELQQLDESGGGGA